MHDKRFCIYALEYIIDCQSIVKEEYIVSTIAQSGKDNQYIENIYGYTDKSSKNHGGNSCQFYQRGQRKSLSLKFLFIQVLLLNTEHNIYQPMD